METITTEFSCVFIFNLSDKPTMVQAKLHYATTNEIGLKLHFPPEIIENLTILYQNRPNNMIQQFDMNPISTSVRLTNLTCGTLYELTIFGSNQVGSSLKEHIFVKTEGSSKLSKAMNFFRFIERLRLF